MLPQLKVLDDVKRQDSDDDFDLDQNETTSTCVVSWNSIGPTCVVATGQDPGKLVVIFSSASVET